MKILSIALLFILISPKTYGQENDGKMREFLTSAAYGTIVGALVGAATLAFIDNPGDELQRVAKGASLGLYAGIALGIYVTQFHGKDVDHDLGSPVVKLPDFIIGPMITENGIEGVSSRYTLLRF